MPRRPPPVAGIRPLEAPGARQAIAPLHAYLREAVLDGTLAPGTKLSQVGLAEQLGVSRTPLREVLRMLQEEGLVETEPNQRTRVAGVAPAQLDDTYATRILVETLALSLTLDSFGAAQADEAERLLAAMHEASASGDLPAWFRDHTAFHRLLTAGGGPSLQRQLRASDGPAAVAELASHLSGTATRVLAHCEPGYVPVAVPQAVALVTGRLGAPPERTLTSA